MIKEFVDKYYEMNPETDDLLFSGYDLANGMVVLTENYKRRIDVSKGFDALLEGYKPEALKWNRWMTVSQLKINKGDQLVGFIAIYPDGTKRKVMLSVDDAWIVKVYSLPADAETDDSEGQESEGCGFHSSEPKSSVEETVSV